MSADVKTSTGPDGTSLLHVNVTITEEDDARQSRDSALRALDELLKVSKNTIGTEAKLFARLKDASNAFYREREKHVAEIAAHAGTAAQLREYAESYKQLSTRAADLQTRLNTAHDQIAQYKARRRAK